MLVQRLTTARRLATVASVAETTSRPCTKGASSSSSSSSRQTRRERGTKQTGGSLTLLTPNTSVDLSRVPLNAAVNVEERSSSGARTGSRRRRDDAILFSSSLIEKNVFHVNAGKAIATLQEELPFALDQELTYDIYSEDIQFVDNVSPQLSRKATSSSGKDAYRRVLWAVRFHNWLFFSKSRVDVHKLWTTDGDRTIKVRFSVRAKPRLANQITAARSASVTLDAISTYRLDTNGKICYHAIENVDRIDPPVTSLASLYAGLAMPNTHAWPTA